MPSPNRQCAVIPGIRDAWEHSSAVVDRESYGGVAARQVQGWADDVVGFCDSHVLRDKTWFRIVFSGGCFFGGGFRLLGVRWKGAFRSSDLVIPRRIHQTQAEAESWTFNLHHCQKNNPVRKSDEPVMTSNRRSEILRDLQKFCAVPSDAIVPIKSDIVPTPPSPTMPLHRIRFNT